MILLGEQKVLVSLSMIAASMLLGAYWLHYVCFLILDSRTESSRSVLIANRANLNFINVRGALESGSSQNQLDSLNHQLTHDFLVLSELLDRFGGLDATERRLLTFEYKMMRTWYRLTRRVSSSNAAEALEEMSSIVRCFAGALAEPSAC
jgi:hypothetical protein